MDLAFGCCGLTNSATGCRLADPANADPANADLADSVVADANYPAAVARGVDSAPQDYVAAVARSVDSAPQDSVAAVVLVVGSAVVAALVFVELAFVGLGPVALRARSCLSAVPASFDLAASVDPAVSVAVPEFEEVSYPLAHDPGQLPC